MDKKYSKSKDPVRAQRSDKFAKPAGGERPQRFGKPTGSEKPAAYGRPAPAERSAGPGKAAGPGKYAGPGKAAAPGKYAGTGKSAGPGRTAGPERERKAAPGFTAGRKPATPGAYVKEPFKDSFKAPVKAPAALPAAALPAQEPEVSATRDLIYGRNPVMEALRHSRPITRLWLLEDTKESVAGEIVGRCREAGIPFKFVDKVFLDRLTEGALHQGLAAQAGAKNYVEWETMLEAAASKGETPLLIILDQVEDPYNLGAVLRSADALGAHGVIIPKHRAVPLTAGVGRSSAGAVEYVPVARVTNLTQTIEKLKKEGLWIIGATAEGKQTIYEADWTGPVAIVMGGEDKGLSRLVATQCDILVSIPMSGHVNSLNVSAAAAIVLSETVRQRRAKIQPQA